MQTLNITITRGEGPSAECGIPHTATSFEEADRILSRMSFTVQEGGGYDKVDFTVVWDGGTPQEDEYTGTYCLKSWRDESLWPSLRNHMQNHLEYCSMTKQPEDMSDANWASYQKYYGDGVTEAQEFINRRFLTTTC